MVQLTFMFSTDGQLVLIWILQMHFWGMLITKSLFFMNTKFMSLTYLLLLCSIMDNSLSQTTPLLVLVSAIQLFKSKGAKSLVAAKFLARILSRILALLLVYLHKCPLYSICLCIYSRKINHSRNISTVLNTKIRALES